MHLLHTFVRDNRITHVSTVRTHKEITRKGCLATPMDINELKAGAEIAEAEGEYMKEQVFAGKGKFKGMKVHLCVYFFTDIARAEQKREQLVKELLSYGAAV